VILYTFFSIVIYYETKWYPPAVIGEDDLGMGIQALATGLATIFVSLLFSMPFVVLSHIYLFKRFFIRRKKDG
jgi:hypothetical protein